MSLKTGFAAEQQAKDYLLAQGLRWLKSNYRCCWGEVDLIMQEKSCLVFVEVRARSSQAFGGAVASVTYTKQQKIAKTAIHYLTVNDKYNKYPMRFDVIGFEGKTRQIEWIKNAFAINF